MTLSHFSLCARFFHSDRHRPHRKARTGPHAPTSDHIDQLRAAGWL